MRVTPIHHYYEHSDCRAAGSMSVLPARLSPFHVTSPSGHSVSNHPDTPCRCFLCRHLFQHGTPAPAVPQEPGWLKISGGNLANCRSGLRRSLAGSSHVMAESSSSPTDWSFASRCFPPRLTATQLRSATYSMPFSPRDFEYKRVAS